MIIPDFNSFEEFNKIFLDFYNAKSRKDSPLEILLKQLQNKPQGLCLEFGVYSGNTIKLIHEFLPTWDIYGFDSFEGLPEDWVTGFRAKAFNLDGNMPKVHSDIKLIKGWFSDTVPIWAENRVITERIKLLHIDCDLYSSTKTIFDHVGQFITHGTIIVFDELLNYPEYEKHELLAFYEFLVSSNKKNSHDFHLLNCGGYNGQQLSLVCIGADLSY